MKRKGDTGHAEAVRTFVARVTTHLKKQRAENPLLLLHKQIRSIRIRDAAVGEETTCNIMSA